MTEIHSGGFAFSRRAVLGCVGAAPLLLSCSRKDGGNQDLDSFMELSGALTGFPPQQLDRELGKLLLTRLVDRGLSKQLQDANSANIADVDAELAVEIIEAWYSGIHKIGDATAVATFTGAKVWDALPFAAIPTVCKGQTGSWSKPYTSPSDSHLGSSGDS